MKFRTTTRYGIRALAEIGKADPDKGILQKDIAEIQHLSVGYLDRIISELKQAGLIKNIKGKKSGYRLAKDPAEISMLEIHLAFEPEIAVIDCLTSEFNCSMKELCSSRTFWEGLNKVIVDYFSCYTLDDIVSNRRHVFQEVFDCEHISE